MGKKRGQRVNVHQMAYQKRTKFDENEIYDKPAPVPELVHFVRITKLIYY